MTFLPTDWLAQITAVLNPTLSSIFPLVALLAGIELGAMVIVFIIGLAKGKAPEDMSWTELEMWLQSATSVQIHAAAERKRELAADVAELKSDIEELEEI